MIHGRWVRVSGHSRGAADAENAPNGLVVTPDVRGLHTDVAGGILRHAGLRAGLIRFARSPHFDSGLVSAQRPAPGASVASGTQVDLMVSSGLLGSG